MVLNFLFLNKSYSYNYKIKTMKTWILAVVLAIGINAGAQERKQRHEHVKMNPEQRTELQVKQMTLALDLSDKQMADIKTLMLDRNKKTEDFRIKRKTDKEAGKKLTGDEKFQLKSKMLDNRITMKREMKKILTEGQYEKWEKMKKNSIHKMKKRHDSMKKERRR